MPIHTRHAPAKGRARPAGPMPDACMCQELPQLALFAADHDATHEGCRATPEEIDQVFGKQLVAHPRSTFLREVVADRARRRLMGESLEDAGMDVLLSTFVEWVRRGQNGDAQSGVAQACLSRSHQGVKEGVVGSSVIAGGHGRRIMETGAAGIAALSRSQEAT